MFRRTLLASAATAVIGCAIDSRAAAPKFRAKTLDGEALDNETLKGKVVLFQFWTTWCQYCRRDESAVESIIDEYSEKGLVVVGVNVNESRKKVKQYLVGNPRSCKVVITEDTNLAAIYAAKAYPLYVAIDREGKLAGTQNGAGGEAALRRLLKKAGLDEQ